MDIINQVKIEYEQDLVYARQRSRLIAELLGFDVNDQTRISTAVSEIARNAFQYAGSGEVEFSVHENTGGQVFTITVRDSGPGIADQQAVLDGDYNSYTGLGQGIPGSRKLVDYFQLDTAAGGGTTVSLGKKLPAAAPAFTRDVLKKITAELTKPQPASTIDEVRMQNQELLYALEQLRINEQKLYQLTEELQETNRGVLALYAELEEKADHLSSANEIKKRCLYSMGHEIRSPINTIIALSDLLLERVDGDLNDEQEKQVSYILQSAKELSGLVNDIMDLAKIEAGKVDISPRETTVTNIFSSLRGMIRPLMRDSGIDLVFDDPGDIPLLYTDESKLSQILRNYLSNALKFTEHGQIRVSAEFITSTDKVVFYVADTGAGIAPEDQEKIFEEYSQLLAPGKQGAKGAGLGLSISRRLAELLGGQVGVESKPGEGSTFFVSVPRSCQVLAETPSNDGE